MSTTDPISLDFMSGLQGDTTNLSAEEVVPFLLAVEAEGVEDMQTLLAAWAQGDRPFSQDIDSPGAAAYAATWRHLLAFTFHDDLPERYWPAGDGRWYEVVRRLLDQPNSIWWDRQDTRGLEDRDTALAEAMRRGRRDLVNLMGSDPQDWNWGDMHRATFRNAVFGESGIGPVEALFNRGGVRTPGGPSLVNAIGWYAPDGYEVDWLPSMRMLIDLSDFQLSRTMHTTGQSGHVFHRHYDDMIDPWARNETKPMGWLRSAIEAEGTLILSPG